MASLFQSWEWIAALLLGVLLAAVLVVAAMLVMRRRRPSRRRVQEGARTGGAAGRSGAGRRSWAAVSIGLAGLSIALLLVILWLIALLEQAGPGIVDGPDAPSDLAARLELREQELVELREALGEARAALAVAQGRLATALEEQRRLYEARIAQLELAGAENDERCLRRLEGLDLAYTRVADSEEKREVEGVETLLCAIRNAVRVTRVGKSTLSTGAVMTCRLAELLTAYERDVVQPVADELFQQPVTRIDHLGTYNCRTIAGSTTISEHAFANGIDLAGFQFADGRNVRVREDWNAGTDASAFVRRIGFGACPLFPVTLTPEANAAHEDHLHLDAGRGSECR